MIDLIENPPLLTALPDPYILEMETKDKGAFGRGFRLLAWEGGSLWSRSFLFASAAAYPRNHGRGCGEACAGIYGRGEQGDGYGWIRRASHAAGALY